GGIGHSAARLFGAGLFDQRGPATKDPTQAAHNASPRVQAGPMVRRLSAGGGSHERIRLYNANSLVTGKNTGNSAPIPTRSLINASQSMVLRPKFPGEETGKFSTAEQRIDLPHQGKLLRDQRKKQPTEERERDPWPICLDATP